MPVMPVVAKKPSCVDVEVGELQRGKKAEFGRGEAGERGGRQGRELSRRQGLDLRLIHSAALR